MSRIEEAMRKTAQSAAAGEARAVPEPAGVSGHPIDPPETFPNECMPEVVIEQRSAIALPSEADVRVVDAKPARPESESLFQRLDAALKEKVVVDRDTQPVSREQYRRLAAALHHSKAQTGLKVIMVTSAVSAEGKTLTSSNLAMTLSESYQRSVLLIDADLRKPSLHQVFRLDGSPGLSEGLLSTAERRLPLHRVSPQLTILTAGAPSSDPMAALTSGRMRLLLDEARESFEWVIIDTPPVGLLTDANLLAAMVDGTVLVIKAASTPYDLVTRAVQAIGQDRLIGVVLNRAVAETSVYGTGYEYGYVQPRIAKTAEPT